MPRKPREGAKMGDERVIKRKPGKKEDVEGLYIGRVGECPLGEEEIVGGANRRLRRALDPDDY